MAAKKYIPSFPRVIPAPRAKRSLLKNFSHFSHSVAFIINRDFGEKLSGEIGFHRERKVITSWKCCDEFTTSDDIYCEQKEEMVNIKSNHSQPGR